MQPYRTANNYITFASRFSGKTNSIISFNEMSSSWLRSISRNICLQRLSLKSTFKVRMKPRNSLRLLCSGLDLKGSLYANVGQSYVSLSQGILQDSRKSAHSISSEDLPVLCSSWRRFLSMRARSLFPRVRAESYCSIVSCKHSASSVVTA